MNYLSYHPNTGINKNKLNYQFLRNGTYERGWTGNWRLRMKRRSAGHTWKHVTVAQLPAKLKMEALILGIQL